jgi:hypothetical protein
LPWLHDHGEFVTLLLPTDEAEAVPLPDGDADETVSAWAGEDIWTQRRRIDARNLVAHADAGHYGFRVVERYRAPVPPGE